MNSFRIKCGRVEVWRDVAELSERAAELLIGIARHTNDAHGSFSVALSGGETPKTLYQLLASEAKASRVPWERTDVFWVDERCVPPTDGRSNYRMAYANLLQHVAVPTEQIHRIRGEDRPEKAAAEYSSEIEKYFHGDPRFSLVLLGMGKDGHTASLFPNSPALHVRDDHVVAVQKEARVSMTLPALNSAETVMFLVAGKEKAKTLSEVLDPKDRKPTEALPASLVGPVRGELIWLIDEAAAKLVSSRF